MPPHRSSIARSRASSRGVEPVRTVGGGQGDQERDEQHGRTEHDQRDGGPVAVAGSTNCTGPVIPNRPRNACVDAGRGRRTRGLPSASMASQTHPSTVATSGPDDQHRHSPRSDRGSGLAVKLRRAASSRTPARARAWPPRRRGP